MRTRTILLLAAAAILAVACASEPTASPTAVPEPTVAQPTELAPGGSFPTFTVDLIEQVGADASVVISDQSGTLTGATSAAPGDGGSVPDGAIQTTSLSADPNTIVLTWTGMPCDTVHALTIAPDGVSMQLDRQRCEGDTVPVDHVLVLTFDHAVDVTKVNPVLRTTG